MSILEDAPRGGISEELAGARRIFCLRNAEIERFEDKHRGIYSLWDGFFGRGLQPNSTEVKNLLALGLVGSGMSDTEAMGVVNTMTPGDLLRAYEVAHGVLGAAFMPDAAESVDEADEDEKKETAPTP